MHTFNMKKYTKKYKSFKKDILRSAYILHTYAQ